MSSLISSPIAVSLLIGCSACWATTGPEPANALWNDANGFGIWIYPETGACPEVRSRIRSFIVIGPGKPLAPGEHKVFRAAELALCSAWVGGEWYANCGSGNLTLTYESGERKYIGSYELKLTDGSLRKGSFRAQYCKPGF